MRGSLYTAIVVVILFVVGFTLLARAAAQEARSQLCYSSCTP